MRGKDYTGFKNGKLTAIGKTNKKTKNGSWLWEFTCECGGEAEAVISDVVRGHKRSCGCLQKEIARKTQLKHGKVGTRLYGIWTNMKTRTTNKNNCNYKNYGERGITICSEWMDFDRFYEWAINNGYRKDLTIERINNDKGYSPSNCKWATLSEQQLNKRNTGVFEICGKRMTLKEVSDITGISIYVLRNRRYRKQELLTSAQYDEIIASMEAKIKEA